MFALIVGYSDFRTGWAAGEGVAEYFHNIILSAHQQLFYTNKPIAVSFQRGV